MKPILCNYYVTYRCNARCTFCDIWKNPKYKNIQDCEIKDVETNLHALKKAGIKFIDFTGGEPLLHKELPQILNIAKKLKFRTSVTTNCIEYVNIAKYIQGKIDFLHFSIDSLDPQKNNSLRGISIHDRILESIELAAQLGERPDLLYTVTPYNYKAIAKLSKFAASKKLILIVNPVFNYSRQTLLSKKILDYIEHYQLKPYVYINHGFHKLIRNNGNDKLRPRCRAISSSIVISPNDELLLPCFHHSIKKIPISSNLTDILKSPEYQQYKRLEGTFNFCKNCTINCYFDPSFLYKFDEYFLLSMISKIKYGYDKYFR